MSSCKLVNRINIILEQEISFLRDENDKLKVRFKESRRLGDANQCCRCDQPCQVKGVTTRDRFQV